MVSQKPKIVPKAWAVTVEESEIKRIIEVVDEYMKTVDDDDIPAISEMFNFKEYVRGKGKNSPVQE